MPDLQRVDPSSFLDRFVERWRRMDPNDTRQRARLDRMKTKAIKAIVDLFDHLDNPLDASQCAMLDSLCIDLFALAARVNEEIRNGLDSGPTESYAESQRMCLEELSSAIEDPELAVQILFTGAHVFT
jgi:hypothetical protein